MMGCILGDDELWRRRIGSGLPLNFLSLRLIRLTDRENRPCLADLDFSDEEDDEGEDEAEEDWERCVLELLSPKKRRNLRFTRRNTLVRPEELFFLLSTTGTGIGVYGCVCDEDRWLRTLPELFPVIFRYQRLIGLNKR
jgi:hypothetical protein